MQNVYFHLHVSEHEKNADQISFEFSFACITYLRPAEVAAATYEYMGANFKELFKLC